MNHNHHRSASAGTGASPSSQSNMMHPPKTPPRMVRRASNLTPSFPTPFVTPVKSTSTSTSAMTTSRAPSHFLHTRTPQQQQRKAFSSPARPAVPHTTGRLTHQHQQQFANRTPVSSRRSIAFGTPSSASRLQQQQPSSHHHTSSSACNSTSADDRFIPSRRHTNLDLCRRALLSGNNDKKRPRAAVSSSAASSPNRTNDANNNNNNNNNTGADSNTGNAAAGAPASQETPLQKEFKRRMLSSLCNVPLSKLDEEGEPTGLLAFNNSSSSSVLSEYSCENAGASFRRGLFSSGRGLGMGPLSQHGGGGYAHRLPALINPFDHDTLRTMKLGDNHTNGFHDSVDLSVAQKVLRKVPAAPFRILDAPDIVDDYYLNLISWSKDNILAVALAQSVYLWNATTGEINHLVTLENPSDYVTSVNWCNMQGHTRYIAVGTNSYAVHLFDAQALRKVRTLLGHTGRVGSLAWNQNWISSGSRDSLILNHDIRSANNVVAKYRGHHQEVCGLKWNDDGTCLASGGNENFLCLWDAAMSNRDTTGRSRDGASGITGIAGRQLTDQSPRLTLQKHRAAVKALDWCPFHRGLLASGGGTSDRTIKFWNSSSGAMLNSIDTGSQVCSIIWSKHQRELCSSHGYSENQLILWKYPSMTRIKELPGHTARVLNMEMSPDGASVVSAAADETLRFWNVFGSPSAFRRSGLMSGGSGGMGALLPLAGDLPFGNTPTIR